MKKPVWEEVFSDVWRLELKTIGVLIAEDVCDPVIGWLEIYGPDGQVLNRFDLSLDRYAGVCTFAVGCKEFRSVNEARRRMPLLSEYGFDADEGLFMFDEVVRQFFNEFPREDPAAVQDARGPCREWEI